MPIRIPDSLPATKTLLSENIFVMTENRALRQDIRPLRILLLNLMPTKITTETQLLRLLGNTPIQVDVDLLQTVTHEAKNTSKEHLLNFYHTFDEIRDQRYDGMIITGAPVELLPFEQVDYWDELCEIMDWTSTHVYSTFYICWGAQAGLYHHYGIQKYELKQKLSGIYLHRPLIPNHALLRGFDDYYYAPHSRYTGMHRADIEAVPDLDVLAVSETAGVHIAASHDCRRFFITGHSEYDRGTLAGEYARDVAKGLAVQIPHGYFPDDDPDRVPALCWRAHASLLFSNWLNYFVYQRTPYDLGRLMESVLDESDSL